MARSANVKIGVGESDIGEVKQMVWEFEGGRLQIEISKSFPEISNIGSNGFRTCKRDAHSVLTHGDPLRNHRRLTWQIRTLVYEYPEEQINVRGVDDDLVTRHPPVDLRKDRGRCDLCESPAAIC